MLLRCIGTNSSGNCYILDADDECLILDAGCSVKDVKIALGFNISKISGVLVTHQHSDHDSYSKAWLKMGIPVIRPFDDNHKSYGLKKGSRFKAKAFALKDLDGNWTHTNGDGSPCPIYGYFITHPDLGNLVYATDTEFIKYKFNNLNHLLMGVNYDMETLEDDGEIKTYHVFKGHQSLQGALKFVSAHNTDDLKNVIMCHLSESNSSPEHFIEEMSKVANCPIYVAKRGMIINL